jgi:hypothetical protein
MPSLVGRCHCGNLSIEVTTSRAPAELASRACVCTFCSARHMRWTSDPSGSVAIGVTDPDELSRYRFGTSTADFLICRRCGSLVAALSHEPLARAVVNIDVLERAAEFAAAVSKSFDGEDVPGRLARRAQSWTPATIA